MPLTFAQKRANQKYTAQNYDQVKVLVKKGQRETIKKIAEERGVSMNEFINKAIENETCKTMPCFVYKLDKPIEYKGGRVFIPIGIQNRADITAYHVQLCQLDDGKFVNVSSCQPEHYISDYLDSDNAGKDETLRFVVCCEKEVGGCDIRFTIQFCTVNGIQYKQDFRVQYSSTFCADGKKGALSRNSHYSLPRRVESL